MDKIKQNIDLQEAIQRYNIEKSVVGTLAYNIDQNLQKGMSVDEAIEDVLQKSKSMPIGTITNGFKKIAEGKWRKVSEHGMTKEEHQTEADRLYNVPKGKDKFIESQIQNEYNKHQGSARESDSKDYSDEEVTGGEKNIVEYRDEFIKTSKSPSVTKTLETKVKYDNGIRTKAENIEKLAQNGIFSERNIEHDRIKASKDHPDAFYTAGGYMREIDKESYILDGYYCSKTEFEYSKFLQNKLK